MEKFYHSNYNTRVHIQSSAITICPGYYHAFKTDILNKYGIKDKFEYKGSNLYGNDSSINERDLYNLVTHNFSEVVKSAKVYLKSGRKFTTDKFDEIKY